MCFSKCLGKQNTVWRELNNPNDAKKGLDGIPQKKGLSGQREKEGVVGGSWDHLSLWKNSRQEGDVMKGTQIDIGGLGTRDSTSTSGDSQINPKQKKGTGIPLSLQVS